MPHPIIYVDAAQCGICHSSLFFESPKDGFAIGSCYRCEVTFKVPIRTYQAEIVNPIVSQANQSAEN